MKGRQTLRARIFLYAMLPLVEVVAADRPVWKRRLARTVAVVQLEVAGSGLAAHLSFDQGSVRATAGRHRAPTIRVVFASPAALCAFFVGTPRLSDLPRVRGAVRHPLALGQALWLLSSLRILRPGAVLTRPSDRALCAKLMLYLVTSALSQLGRGGDPEMMALVHASPDRVYQWSITDIGTGAYVRMCQGKIKAGRGEYGRKRPFVRFTFPRAEGAYRVFTAGGSQMAGVIRGDVRPEGSPEYSRKISLMMQAVDALLLGSDYRGAGPTGPTGPKDMPGHRNEERP